MPDQDPDAKRAAKRAYDRARYLANPDAVKARSQAWKENNRERYNELNRKRNRVSNPKFAKTRRAWHRATRERNNARRRQLRKEDLEYARALDHARYRRNPGKSAGTQRRRRARLYQAPLNDLTSAQWEEIQAAYGYRCVYCPPHCWRCQRRKHALTQDHISPLGPTGPHTLQNIVPACRACNARKGQGEPLVPVQPLLLSLAPKKKAS